MASQGSLQKLGITPVMCASAKTPYALELVARLQACAPNCVVHTEFLGPEQLARVRTGLPDACLVHLVCRNGCSILCCEKPGLPEQLKQSILTGIQPGGVAVLWPAHLQVC